MSLEYQRGLVEMLRSGEKNAYEDAAIYTILLDLVDENGVDEVFKILHNVATDLGELEELESRFDDAKKNGGLGRTVSKKKTNGKIYRQTVSRMEAT